MGILDDAIRQHLELKRQHGADDTDLERLEQEAFGPATRPGDPEFDTGAEPVVGEGEPMEDFPGSEAATTVAPQVRDRPDAGPPSSAPDPEPPPPSSPDPVAGELPPESSPAEQARIEHPHLADTVDHPALEPLPQAPGPEQAPEPAATGPDPVEAPEGSIFFDQDSADEEAARLAGPAFPDAEPAADPDDDEIEEVAFEDFELDLEQPAAPVQEEPPFAGGEAPVTQVPFEPAAPAPQEPAGDPEGDEGDFDLEIELEDEPFDESLDQAPPTAVQPPAPGTVPPEPASEIEFELDEELEDQIEDEDEDLLEETPDFLQDAPEGERLWFEQGEPKDFDFDED